MKVKDGPPEFRLTMPEKEFNGHVEALKSTLAKGLNKAQVLAVAKGVGLSSPKTKKDAIDRIALAITQRRGTRARGFA